MTRQPQSHPGFQFWLIVLGSALFFWLGKEDSDAVAVTALGWALAGSLLWRVFMQGRRFDMPARGLLSLLVQMLCGLCFGALTSLFTAALMLLKDLRHGHVFPDYPPEMIIMALERLPAWSLAGGLIGLALGLLLRVCAGSWQRQA